MTLSLKKAENRCKQTKNLLCQVTIHSNSSISSGVVASTAGGATVEAEVEGILGKWQLGRG